jgi:mannose-6-phosphate isomerase-like protein (cupin superfamily)
MWITRKDFVKEPFVDSKGEIVYELIGSSKKSAGAVKHSLAYDVIPPGCSSKLHYHPQDEETYYILKGSGNIVINKKEHQIKLGDAIFIQPTESHQIFTTGNTDLEFIVVCAPAWQPANSVFL